MTFEVIPAIDLRGGRCVRLFQGDYAQETVFGDDPEAMARRWEREGARRLHVVDLDGARAGAPLQLEVVRRITASVTVPVQVSGGLRDREAVVAALAAGAQRAIIGTAALNGELARELCREFGDQLVIGIDARGGRVAVRGWLEESGREALELARDLEAAGAPRIIFTDIGRDGTLSGPALEATRDLVQALSIPVIASGGIGSPDDVRAVAALAPLGVEGVIIGRALYIGAVNLSEVTE
jgi:phosphoribosylformimino-5-aminoimidazole carboxamide ribotide isomerase